MSPGQCVIGNASVDHETVVEFEVIKRKIDGFVGIILDESILRKSRGIKVGMS